MELGALGLGLVWGWLLGLLSAHAANWLRTGVVLGAATIALAVEVLWLTEWKAAAILVIAILLAFLLYFTLRHGLSERYGPFGKQRRNR